MSKPLTEWSVTGRGIVHTSKSTQHRAAGRARAAAVLAKGEGRVSRRVPGEQDVSRALTLLVQKAFEYGFQCAEDASPRSDKELRQAQKATILVVRNALAIARLGTVQWLKLHPEHQTHRFVKRESS